MTDKSRFSFHSVENSSFLKKILWHLHFIDPSFIQQHLLIIISNKLRSSSSFFSIFCEQLERILIFSIIHFGSLLWYAWAKPRIYYFHVSSPTNEIDWLPCFLTRSPNIVVCGEVCRFRHELPVGLLWGYGRSARYQDFFSESLRWNETRRHLHQAR